VRGEPAVTSPGATSTPPCRDPLSTDASLGQVFGSVEAFARMQYGNHATDGDIRQEPVARSRFVWLIDRTPETNGTWRLFERLDGGGTRYLLCHVAGYWTREPFGTLDDPVVLEESLQPYGAAERVTYEFDAVRGYYVPTHCATRVLVSTTSQSEAPECHAADDYSSVDIPWDCRERVFGCD